MPAAAVVTELTPPAPDAALPKTYDPAGTESRWQHAWESSGAFHPDPAAEGDPFLSLIHI